LTQVASQFVQPNAASPPDFTRLIELGEAAAAMSMNEGSLRRKCAEQWQPQGLAWRLKDPSSGREKWYIFRDADRRLTAGGIGELHQEHRVDLSGLSRKQLTEAMQRKYAVEKFLNAIANRPGKVADWIDQLIDELSQDKRAPERISRSRLYAWRKSYQRGGDIMSLVDQRGGDQKSVGDPTCWKYFTRLYLDPKQPSVKWCWEQTRSYAKRQGMSWGGYDACRKQLNDRIPPEQQTAIRDPKAWRDQLAPRIDQDPEAWGAGTRWDGDHAQLDFWCRMPDGRVIRPWITAWKDWRSRRIVGWILSDAPNSSTILAAFRKAVRDPRNLTLPDEVRIDNGKDYDCYIFHGQTKTQRLKKIKLDQDEAHFGGIYKLLEIEAHFSIPHNPTGKSRIERWFGTLHDRFDRTWDTYCGRSADHRPEGLNKLLRDPSKAPSFETVQREITAYIDKWNASADHHVDDLIVDAVKISPDDFLERFCDRRRTPPDPAVLDLMDQHWHKPVRVGKQGITINPYGVRVSYGAFDPALMPYKALKAKDRPHVLVSFDPDDPGQIRVYDTKFRYICTATENEKGGARGTDRRQAGRLIKQQREYRSSLKVTKKLAMVDVLSPAQLMEENAAEALKDAHTLPPDNTPHSMRLPVTHEAFEEAAKAIQKDELRRAAGAETMASQTTDENSIDWDTKISQQRDQDSCLGAISDFADAGDDIDSMNFSLQDFGAMVAPNDTDVFNATSDESEGPDADDEPHVLELI